MAGSALWLRKRTETGKRTGFLPSTITYMQDFDSLSYLVNVGPLFSLSLFFFSLSQLNVFIC